MAGLHPLDTGFLELEEADRHISLGIGVVAVIAGTPPDRDRMRARIADIADRQPRLRQRVRRSQWDLGAPAWVDDPAFDPDHHLRWTALPEPGDERVLRELIASELEQRLDPDRPLWRCLVIERLAGERWAIMIQAHHAMVDGISGVSLLESFCDSTDSGRKMPSATTPGRLGALHLASRALRLSMQAPGLALSMARSLAPVVWAAAGPGAPSSFNGSIGRQRRYAIARAGLPEVQAIGAAFGATVNDVAVAAITAAYRAVLRRRGETPTDTMRVLIPRSMRGQRAKHVLDNRVSAMLAELPIEVDDPVDRLVAVRRRVASQRDSGAAEAEKTVLALAEWLPFPAVAWALRFVVHYPQRGVAALATNVPGPRRRLTLDSRPVLELLPCMPIAMRLRTTIAILSYTDQLVFGITGDYDSTPDIDVLSAGIEHGLAELLMRAQAAATTPPLERGPAE
ncbi:wax ester/triacylglycerol synthase family O-acyltransferase [Nocardia sp. alder85J]|uniref:wax ester/triacylglycerol synthase family O-acyltransferase n=1 Tax=Nocardia sp. alder85J TaxID=2862949 RepID=UPI001CD395F1|nr:wax ester/triacylglycerol synthase family O-acyltransferase [Nocardia sp. alder85J]MCX4092422.1 wax ester/triacylglycerol synthase family O-acyltransferase [Nocardia sp. alder85J]